MVPPAQQVLQVQMEPQVQLAYKAHLALPGRQELLAPPALRVPPEPLA